VDYEALQQCTELRDAHIAHAVSSSEAMEALLARFAQIAAPGKGAPIILAALARLGTTACDWIDGELRIEISGGADKTKIAVSTAIGAGFREKLFSDTVLRVPFEEFRRGIAKAPRLIDPLRVKDSGKLIVLSATQEIRRTSLPPPMVQIDPTSFMVVPEIVVPKMGVPVDIKEDVLPMSRSVTIPSIPKPAPPRPGAPRAPAAPADGAKRMATRVGIAAEPAKTDPARKVVLRKRTKDGDPQG
jgi:hypothetical protein